MATRRIVACLDLQAGRVVKGVQFEQLRSVGDPVLLAQHYEAQGADEVVLLDISATQEGREAMWEAIERTAAALFIPLCVGGGIRSVEDVARALRAGADKVSINSAAVEDPSLLGACAARFGSQCVVASIDARRGPGGAEVFTAGGRRPTGLSVIDWARTCAARGAGEILLTSIDRDGARTGYDLELTREVAAAVSVPVVASGGAGSAEHVRAVIQEAGADAALLAGVLHDGSVTLRDLKRALAGWGVPVRREENAT